MMHAAPFTSGAVDPFFKETIGIIKNALKEKDDDFLLLCTGMTGAGKSMLMLHAIEEYLGDKASIDFIGMDRQQFSDVLKRCKAMPTPRFAGYDEANISKRDSMTRWNKDLIDLFFAIRGLQIFHWWNNPSIDMLDKAFIQERIKGFILITTKEIDRPRTYYFFRKVDLLKIFEKYGSLKLDVLKKVRKKYAYYRGWFKDYDGPLRREYEAKKQSRMVYKIDDFFEKYGQPEDFVTRQMAAKMLGVNVDTVARYEKDLADELDDSLIRETSAGRRQYSLRCVELFKARAKELRELSFKNLDRGRLRKS